MHGFGKMQLPTRGACLPPERIRACDIDLRSQKPYLVVEIAVVALIGDLAAPAAVVL